MKKISKALALFMVLVTMLSFVPQTTYAATGYARIVSVTAKDGFSKDGKYYSPYTVKNVSEKAVLKVSARIVNSSGNTIVNFQTYEFNPGQSKEFGYGYNYSGLPTGKYTLIMHVANWNYAGEIESYDWKRSVNHTEPEAQITFKGHETYYDDNGRYINKITITCKNMKGQKLYCKVYDEYGDLMYDWGKDTPARKTNNEVGFFGWSGTVNGVKQPSGEYTFVITNSANKQVIEKTLKLKILGGNG